MRRLCRWTCLVLALSALDLAGPGPAPLTAQSAGPAAGDTARVVERMALRHADHSLVTRHGDVVLLIVGDDLLLQLTDEGLDGLGEDRGEGDEDQGLGARLVRAMITAGVRTLLDNAVAHPIARIHEADVVDGRLELRTLDGDELFDIEVNDRDIMADFDERQAKRFVRELRRRMPAP